MNFNLKQKLSFSIILIIIIISLSGCWSKKELNELSIATAIGIDKSKEGYLVTVQLLNPGEVAAQKEVTTRSPVTVYRTTGESIFEALRKLTQQTPRKVYVAHVRIVVIGEELAREGISEVLDFISRDHEFRTDFFVLIAKNTSAKNVLNVLTPLERIPANKIFSSLEMSEKNWAPTKAVQLDELIRSLVSEGKNPVLTGIIIKGDNEIGKSIKNVETVDPFTSVEVGNLGVFKNDKLIGWLNAFESIGYNHIDDNISNTILTFPFENKDGVIGIELTSSKTNIKAKIIDGKPMIDIKIKAEGNVADVEQKIDLTKSETINKLEKTFAQQIKMKVEMVLRTAQKKYASDIFGFGEAVYRTDPKLWREIKGDWSEIFKKLPVSVEVETKIKGLGTITNSFIQEMKE